MSLLDLIANPTNFTVGVTLPNGNIQPNYNLSYGGPSKSIKYGGRSGEKKTPSYHLVDRVTWYGSKSGGEGEPHYNTEPTFQGFGLLGLFDGEGKDHKSSLPDYILRGGNEAFLDRRQIDFQRISNFLYESDGVGTQFLIRQGALQLLNPRPETRTFNAGVSMLSQIAASGFSSFKRHGLLPEPVGLDVNSSIGGGLNNLIGGAVGNFLENAVGGDYNSTRPNTRISINGSAEGDPGRPKYKTTFGKIIDTLIDNPFKPKDTGRLVDKKGKGLKYNDEGTTAYTSRLNDEFASIDKINLNKITYHSENPNDLNVHIYGSRYEDTVAFNFEIIDQKGAVGSNNHYKIRFRALLDSWGDDYSSTHNEVKYNGRGESFYTYNKFSRKINISFKVAAQSVFELKPIYQKLNFLAAQTAPGYSRFSGRIMTPYMRLTMGDYFYKIPGILNNLNISWDKNYPWEINHEKSRLLKVLPHILDVSVSFTPIHDFVPNSDYNTPFIGLSDNNFASSIDWLEINPKDNAFTDNGGFLSDTSVGARIPDPNAEEGDVPFKYGNVSYDNETGRVVLRDPDNGDIIENQFI